MSIVTYSFLLILLPAGPLRAISVKPSLCPTNKIAPHKRVANWEYVRGRTFGAFYDLLAPNNPPYYVPTDDLQETPQADDPDDCGDIEDYDENDLSSLVSPVRRRGSRDSQRFFNIFPHQAPTTARTTTARATPPTRPPYWSGGPFASNAYRPPPQYITPTSHVKPIYEYNDHQHVPYRPNVVGGPLAHVVGVPPPAYRPQEQTSPPRLNSNRYRLSPTPPAAIYPNSSKPRHNNNESILGSFIDLLFK